MLKKIVKRYPGVALTVILAQLFLIGVLLTLVYLSGQTADRLRVTGTIRASAAFGREMEELAAIAQGESTLSAEQKWLVFYHKAVSAAENLAGTGYTEEIKRTLTEGLSRLSGHMLALEAGEEPVLTEEELRFLRTYAGVTDGDRLSALCLREKIGTEPSHVEEETALQLSFPWEAREAEKIANRLMGTRDVLTEVTSPVTGQYLFTCANACVLMDGAEMCPLAAQHCSLCKAGGETLSEEECRTIAGDLVMGAYPKKIARRMTVAEERLLPDRMEFVFQGTKDRRITVAIHRGTGRLLSLYTEGFGKCRGK